MDIMNSGKIFRAVYANIWTDENGKLQTTKAPTTVLFDRDGNFYSFGYEAEKTYADLADDDEHHGWMYFKHFKMNLHGNTACIPSDQFSFALEPEAAIYCKQYEASRCEETDGTATIKTFAPGSQFLVLDLVGGTVDITASEVQQDGALKELYHPSGGPWGGTLVDREMYCFFEEIFGNDVLKRFKLETKLDYLEMAVTLEAKKRQCNTKKASTDVRITLPNSIYTLYKKMKGVKLESELSKSGSAKSVKMTKDKLRVENNEFVKMFENPKHLLLEHLNELLDKPELKKVSTLMMVGGFSESPIMQRAVMEAFPNKHVIIPQDAGTVVMKGAVMFGFKKEVIHSRKLPFSYGKYDLNVFHNSKHTILKCV
ncbi:heat shock 70 kDa protein 12A-like [Mercenaria mercenaria]|uniref:heat shock 70 kDa protein 12A-like n=1 Tax=Mercenaria mercenaria TaxID=6596 RepID=UPI00234FB1FB|nr:heat shock 70 kDa protein 12A-like [Mercenaria mercenaria]